MVDKDKLLNEDMIDDCEGDDCDCGAEPNIITLDMEDGTTKDFLVLDIMEFEDKHYIALAEVGSDEYDILNFVENEKEETIELNVIDDDDLFDRVAEAFEDRFAAFEELEEM